MTTDRRRLPAIWKIRRDGIRQRYRVNLAARERDKRLVQSVESTLDTADYETTAAFIQTPEVVDAIDRLWDDIYHYAGYYLKRNLEVALRHIGDESIPLLERLLHRPKSMHPSYGTSISADLALRVIGHRRLQQFREQVYRTLLDHQQILDYHTDKTNNWDLHLHEVGEAALRCAAQLGDTRIGSMLESMLIPRRDTAAELVAELYPLVADRETAIKQLGRAYETLMNMSRRTMDLMDLRMAHTILKGLARLRADAYAPVIHDSIASFVRTAAQNANREFNIGLLEAGYPPSVVTLLAEIADRSSTRFDEAPEVVTSAIAGLGRSGDPSAIPVLLAHAMTNDEYKKLYDESEYVPVYARDYREHAYEALAQLRATSHMSDDDARELLHQMVRFMREGYGKFTRTDSDLPYRVANHIQQMGDLRVLPIIESHLREETRPSYRVALYTAYAGVGAKDAVPFLIQQFDSEPPQVQSAIVHALRRIDTPDARRFLQTVPSNPNASPLAKLALHAPTEKRT